MADAGGGSDDIGGVSSTCNGGGVSAGDGNASGSYNNSDGVLVAAAMLAVVVLVVGSSAPHHTTWHSAKAMLGTNLAAGSKQHGAGAKRCWEQRWKGAGAVLGYSTKDGAGNCTGVGLRRKLRSCHRALFLNHSLRTVHLGLNL